MPMPIRSVSLSLTLLALFAAVSVPAQVKFAQKKGDSQRYTVKQKMDVGGTEAEVVSEVQNEVVDIADSGVSLKSTTKSLKIFLNGEQMEPAPEATPYEVKTGKGGELTSVKGGIEGVDTVRQFLVTHFFAPEGDLTKDQPVKRTFEKAGEVPKLAVETTYLGEDTLNGVKVHKFSQKVAEDGNYGISVESTVWFNAEGVMVKKEAKFKNLPILVASADASGTCTIELNAK